MFLKLVAVVGLFSAFASAQTEDPNPAPDYCNDKINRGYGRATIDRWGYNYTSKDCEIFQWTGGAAEGNNFETKRECEATCKRTSIQKRFLSSCSFTANLARDCSFTSIDSNRIILCLGQPDFSLTREECATRGCCWRFGVCLQSKDTLVQPPCTIRGSSDLGFWGKIDFQAGQSYPENWVGLLKLDTPVDGSVCTLRQQYVTNYVSINKSFGNRTSFLLKGSQLDAGQNVVILFAGNRRESEISDKCSSINSPN